MSETKPTNKTDEPGSTAIDPKGTHLVRELQHDRGKLACRYEPTGKYLFSAGLDYLVHRWHLADESKEGKRDELLGHESWIRAMDFSPNGKELVTGDYVGRVIVWPALSEKPEPRLSFQAHEGSVRSVAVSPDGKWIATAGNDRMVRVWSIADGSRKLELSGHDCHVYNTAFHPDGNALVSADLKGVIRHWEFPSGKLVRELDAGLLYTYSEKYSVDVGGVRGMSFNADGSQLACTGATGEKGIAHSGNARVVLLDWKSGKQKAELKPEKVEIATAWAVRFHPDGFIVASGGSRTGGYLWFWKPGEDVAFHIVKFKQRAPGFDLDLAPDKKTLAVANHDGAIRFYEMTPAPPPIKPGKPKKKTG